MGETPAKITKSMGDTRARIEANVASLKTNTASQAADVSQRIALTVDTLGTSAGEAVRATTAGIPKLSNPTPVLFACAMLGFAIGFIAPLAEIERDRLRPLADEVVRQAKAARANLLGTT